MIFLTLSFHLFLHVYSENLVFFVPFFYIYRQAVMGPQIKSLSVSLKFKLALILRPFLVKDRFQSPNFFIEPGLTYVFTF